MIKIFLKTTFILCSLILVVGSIYKLKTTDNLEESLGLILYGSNPKNSVAWCTTRVDKIEVPGKFKVFQDGMKWFKEGSSGETAELGFIPVEKWFAKHCRLSAEGKTEGFATELAGPDQATLAIVGFVNGSEAAFKEITQGIFTWDDVTFRSEQLKDALMELDQLPKIGGSEKGTAPGH
jgi:hypothetical protein